MKDKFNITREENVFIAKRNIADYIWKSSNLEEILNGEYESKITINYKRIDNAFKIIYTFVIKCWWNY